MALGRLIAAGAVNKLEDICKLASSEQRNTTPNLKKMSQREAEEYR